MIKQNVKNCGVIDRVARPEEYDRNGHRKKPSLKKATPSMEICRIQTMTILHESMILTDASVPADKACITRCDQALKEWSPMETQDQIMESWGRSFDIHPHWLW